MMFFNRLDSTLASTPAFARQFSPESASGFAERKDQVR